MGLRTVDLQAFVEDAPEGFVITDGTQLYPVGNTWLMGFSWSSAVAQSVTLHICKCAGLKCEQIICDSEPPSRCRDELVTACTDDVLFFHLDEVAARERLHRYDAAMEEHMVPRNMGK